MPRSILIAHPGADLYGSDRVMLGTVEALKDRGWQVVVSLPAPGPLVAEIERRGGRVEYCVTPVLRKSALRPRGMAALLSATIRGLPAGWKLIRASRADVVYVSTLTLPSWLLLAKLCRRPVMCHVHEAEQMSALPIRRLLALPLFMANRVIANSEFTRQVLIDTFGRLGRSTDVVLNSVLAPDVVSPARSRLVGPFRLLFVGRLSPRKGPQLAVDIVQALAQRGVDYRLDLVGSVFAGYEWFETELIAKVNSAGLTEQVKFHGFVDDIWPVLGSGDLVLVPSQADESFGNIAVEALLAGRPVVVSANGGLTEAVSAFESAQVVPAAELIGWVDAVEQVRQDWDGYRTAAARDAQLAAVLYAPARYQQQIADRLEQLVGARTGT